MIIIMIIIWKSFPHGRLLALRLAFRALLLDPCPPFVSP